MSTFNKFVIALLVCIVIAFLTVSFALRAQDTADAATMSAHSYEHAVKVYTVETTRPLIAAYFARPDACRTWNIGGVDATDGIACWNMSPAPMVTVDNVPQNAPEASYVLNTPIVDDGDNPTKDPIVTDKPELPADDNPVVTVDTPKEKKQKCNNGNGNGAEGCNASDKGNQDETPEKGDKGPEHKNK